MPACRIPVAIGLIGASAAAVAWSAGAVALVGGAPPAEPAIARHLVLLVGSRGTACSGVAIAQSLVLTAAHCAAPGAEYRVVEFDAAHAPILKAIDRVVQHPGFALAAMVAHRATADVALMKLAAPLPANFTPAPLASASLKVAAGDAFTVAGFGLTVRGDGTTGGTARAAALVVTGQPGGLQIRLVDPAGKGERAGLGACTGDSGAPVFVGGEQAAVIGIVSWSTGPKLGAGCGGITGVTPLARYRGWIVETAETLGAPLPP